MPQIKHSWVWVVPIWTLARCARSCSNGYNPNSTVLYLGHLSTVRNNLFLNYSKATSNLFINSYLSFVILWLIIIWSADRDTKFRMANVIKWKFATRFGHVICYRDAKFKMAERCHAFIWLNTVLLLWNSWNSPGFSGYADFEGTVQLEHLALTEQGLKRTTDTLNRITKEHAVLGRCYPHTVDSRYLEDQGTLWNTSRYPYPDILDVQNSGRNKTNNHTSQKNM